MFEYRAAIKALHGVIASPNAGWIIGLLLPGTKRGHHIVPVGNGRAEGPNRCSKHVDELDLQVTGQEE